MGTPHVTYTQQNFNAGDTWTVSPNLLNQFRLTYVRNFGGRVPDPQTPISAFGSNFQVQGTPSLPQIRSRVISTRPTRSPARSRGATITASEK